MVKLESLLRPPAGVMSYRYEFLDILQIMVVSYFDVIFIFKI
jgi:hypothetical protein